MIPQEPNKSCRVSKGLFVSPFSKDAFLTICYFLYEETLKTQVSSKIMMFFLKRHLHTVLDLQVQYTTAGCQQYESHLVF